MIEAHTLGPSSSLRTQFFGDCFDAAIAAGLIGPASLIAEASAAEGGVPSCRSIEGLQSCRRSSRLCGSRRADGSPIQQICVSVNILSSVSASWEARDHDDDDRQNPDAAAPGRMALARRSSVPGGDFPAARGRCSVQECGWPGLPQCTWERRMVLD